MRKQTRILGLISIFIILIIVLTSCSLGQKNAPETQTVVTRGDLTVKVNGNAKLMYENDARISFGVSGQIVKVLVKKGDSVAKGDLLAQLETSSLELGLSQAKASEASARISLTQAKIVVTQAQSDVTQSQIALSEAKSAVLQSQVSLSAAQINLDKTQAVKEIKDDITGTEWQIEIAKAQMAASLHSGSSDGGYWASVISQYQADLAKHQDDLAKLLAKDAYAGIATYELEGLKYDRLIVQDARLKEQQIEAAQRAVDLDQQNIDLAEQNVEKAQQNVSLRQQSVDQADLYLTQCTKAVQVAQKQLDYASITAPFAGLVVDVGLKQGDFVGGPGLGSANSIYLVDPRTLDINTEIDEIDVAQVQVGQKAIIDLDALPGGNFEGVVSSISTVPVTNALNPGVVIYSVKISFAGAPPSASKSGMSSNVDIITQEKKGVVLVPNKSIKRNNQGQSVISVVSGEKTEERTVVLGSSDGTNTEVISGLQEGERIVKVAQDSRSG